MIARLRGKPVASTPEGLVLDVGGVGYLVAATPSAIRKADGADEVTLETYLHVREDALQLYGFAERAERELFVQLLLGQRRRPEGRARDRLRLAAPTSCAARSCARTRRASRRSPASARRRRSGSCSS